MRPPNRNLSPAAEPWGRYIENEVIALGSALNGMSSGVDSEGRVQNSSMDSLAMQINELNQRQTQTVAAPPINVAVTGTSWVSTSQDISLPASDFTRMAQVSFSGIIDISAPTLPTTTFLSITVDGAPLFRQSFQVPASASSPPGWVGGGIGAFGGIRVPAGTSPTMTLSLSSMGFTAGARNVYIDSGSASITYGQRVA